MTYLELIERLSNLALRISDDLDCVVKLQTLHGTVAGAATTDVVAAHPGIDWDMGKLFFRTAVPVASVDDDYRQAADRAKRDAEALAFVAMSLRDKRLDAAGKLRAIRGTLERLNAPLMDAVRRAEEAQHAAKMGRARTKGKTE